MDWKDVNTLMIWLAAVHAEQVKTNELLTEIRDDARVARGEPTPASALGYGPA